MTDKSLPDLSSSTSLDILREQGPMTLRDLTAATAKRMRCTLMYDDVFGVMARHEHEGQARHTIENDYRDDIWSARAPQLASQLPSSAVAPDEERQDAEVDVYMDGKHIGRAKPGADREAAYRESQQSQEDR